MIQQIKEGLRDLALTVKNKMTINKELRNKIKELTEIIEQYKILFNNKYSQQSRNENNCKQEIKSQLKQFIQHLQKKNTMIKGEIESMNNSVHELHYEFYKRNSSIVNELEREKENNFILSNKIKQKDNDIKGITIVLNKSRRYPLFQEAKREIQIEDKEENDTCFKYCLTSY